MSAAVNSKTPEIASNSVLAYSLAVRTGSPLAQEVDGGSEGAQSYVLARVLSFTPSQSRTITRVYEVNAFNGGRAVELVPGGIADDNVAISRMETYAQTMLEALDPKSHMLVDSDGTTIEDLGDVENPRGRGGVDNLVFQRRPFHLERYVFFPNLLVGGASTLPNSGGDDGLNVRLDIYCNCFVQDISKTVDVSGGGGGLVQSDVTAQVTKRRSTFLNVDDAKTFASTIFDSSSDPREFGELTPQTGHPSFNPSGNQGNGSLSATINSVEGQRASEQENGE